MTWRPSPFSFSSLVRQLLHSECVDVVSIMHPAILSLVNCICPVLRAVCFCYDVSYDDCVANALCGPNHPSLKKVAFLRAVGLAV